MRNALEHTEEIVTRLGVHPMLLLDFDGTLAPLVPRPLDAYAPASTVDALRQCATRHRLAIISGRTLEDIRARLPVEGAWYAGSHGLEWEIDGETARKETPQKLMDALSAARGEIEGLAASFDGLIAEDKVHCYAVNYRALDADTAEEFRARAYALVAPYLPRGLRVLDGMRTFEIAPKIDWTKGECALLLLAAAREKSGVVHAPLYIGDSITDEDAFLALSRDGVTVRVEQNDESAAEFFLPDQASVEHFLRKTCL